MPKKSKGPRMGSKRKAKDPGSSSDRSGYRQKIRQKKQFEASKRKGCAPLALMVLSIPVAAVAVFWFILL
jgi:hypothetical protein